MEGFKSLHTPPSEKSIESFEKFLGVGLPGEFKSFLLKFNGVLPKKDMFRYKPNGKSSIRKLFDLGFSEDDLIHNFRNWNTEINHRRDFLPIGEDYFGNLICLQLRGKGSGSVWFWDHELDSLSPTLPTTFNDFLSSLKTVERLNESELFIRDCKMPEFMNRLEDILAGKQDEASDYARMSVYLNRADLLNVMLKRGVSSSGLIHVAARTGNINAIDILLQMGEKIDALSVDEFKQTPLHCAVNLSEINAVKYFLERGANPNAVDARGETVLDTAVRIGKQPIIELLRAAGAKTRSKK